MTFRQGINFRGPTHRVGEDGADEYHESSLSANYPTTTPQGANVGFESISGTTYQGQSATNDVRLAGCISTWWANAPTVYRVDLPQSGDYSIRVAAGRSDFARRVDVRLQDDLATPVNLVSVAAMIGVNIYTDAQDTELTAADWPDNNSPKEISFSSTVARFLIGGRAVDDYIVFAHAYIEEVGGEEPPNPIDLTTTAQSSTESSSTLNTGITLVSVAVAALIAYASLITTIDLSSAANQKTASQSELTTATHLHVESFTRHDQASALTTHLLLSGAGVQHSSAWAGLAVDVNLSGLAGSHAQSLADLLTGVTLSGQAALATSAQAAINLGEGLFGQARSGFTAQADLAVHPQFLSAAHVGANAVAALNTLLSLQSDAPMRVFAQAAIMQPSEFSGSAGARLLSVADLSTWVDLHAAAGVRTDASASFAAGDSWLEGAAQAEFYATGALSARNHLVAIVSVRATSAGDLSLRPGLRGEAASGWLAEAGLSSAIWFESEAVASIAATANIDGAPRSVPQSPRYTVTATRRNYCVAA